MAEPLDRQRLEGRIVELKGELQGLQRQLRGNLLGKVKLLSLTVAGEQYALALEAVERVVWIPRLSPAPEAGPEVAGLLNLGGEPIVVVDLGQVLGRASQPWNPYTPLVVLHWAQNWLGVIADELGEVITLEVTPPDPSLPAHSYLASYYAGPPPIMVLDHSRLLNTEVVSWKS